MTALEFALAAEQREIVWELLQRGAKPRKNKGDNLLLDAPKFRDLELFGRLVELGANVHGADRRGQTPLLIAVAAGFYDGVRFLLDQGADPLVRTKYTDRVFDFAARTRQFCSGLLPRAEGELADLFRSHLADLDRIEELFEARLPRDQIDAVPPPKPELETFWDLGHDVAFHLAIRPFPFTSKQVSRLEGRLTRRLPGWEAHFSQGQGIILFRVQGDRDKGDWTPFAYAGGNRRFLLYEGGSAPAGWARVDVRFDTDLGFVVGELSGWEVVVDA